MISVGSISDCKDITPSRDLCWSCSAPDEYCYLQQPCSCTVPRTYAYTLVVINIPEVKKPRDCIYSITIHQSGEDMAGMCTEDLPSPTTTFSIFRNMDGQFDAMMKDHLAPYKSILVTDDTKMGHSDLHRYVTFAYGFTGVATRESYAKEFISMCTDAYKFVQPTISTQKQNPHMSKKTKHAK